MVTTGACKVGVQWAKEAICVRNRASPAASQESWTIMGVGPWTGAQWECQAVQENQEWESAFCRLGCRSTCGAHQPITPHTRAEMGKGGSLSSRSWAAAPGQMHRTSGSFWPRCGQHSSWVLPRERRGRQDRRASPQARPHNRSWGWGKRAAKAAHTPNHAPGHQETSPGHRYTGPHTQNQVQGVLGQPGVYSQQN